MRAGDRIRNVAEIVRDQDGPVAVVVSALGGITDELILTAEKAAAGDETYRESFAALAERHRTTLQELAPDDTETAQALENALGDLRNILHGTFLVREASARTMDSITSYGERLSSKIVAATFRNVGLKSAACDARKLIRTDATFGGARVDFDATGEAVRRHFKNAGDTVQVVTGFIAATPEGETTTLGRGGSDYTASILGACLGVEAVELWTDVDGVMSADPRRVPNAQPISDLTYEELMELSHFGAKVVHPPSVHPTRSADIPLWIKNTFNPKHRGTRVSDEADGAAATSGPPVRGIASIHEVALLRLEGDGMVGVPGIAARLFGALAKRQVSIILISQASSEHSICFAIAPTDVAAARQSVAEEFALEENAGLIDPLIVEDKMSVIAAVGAGMRHRAGIAGRIFSVLGRHGVNVRAISQGSSELNISLVVGQEDENAALRTIHDAFVEEERAPAAVAVAGVGQIGGAFLAQLARPRPGGRPLRLVGVAGSRTYLHDAAGLAPATAAEDLRNASAGNAADLAERLVKAGGRRVFVDVTAHHAVTELYDALLAAGVHVVTANKLRVAGPGNAWEPLAAGPGRLYHEATVGAGLPVVRTLQDLTSTGDRIDRIEGVLSGTLAYLCDQLRQGVAFSQAVRQAHELGYTEPDPREDLGGQDVARKLLILARLCGRRMEPDEIQVESLLPGPEWAEMSLDEFWQRLPELDAPFARQQEENQEARKTLCYLSTLDGEGGRVALQGVGKEHPCASLRGTDNLIAISTERYCETPLVVRGPGAGPAVTAAGVFGDVLRAVREVS